MAEEEEPKPDLLHQNTLIAWERIHLPSLPTKFPSQSPLILLSDPHCHNGYHQSTPKEHHTSVVFPPTNHEGLNLHHQSDVHEIRNESAKSSPSLVNVEPVAVKPSAMGESIAVKWRLLKFKLPGIVSWVWNCCVIRGGLFRPVWFPLIGSTVLLLLFCFRFRLRRRRRLRGEVVDELLGVIKEKDEKIHNLLYQIARMNELLLATHHGVPMISKPTSS